jgi:hypothetical protein
MKIYKCNGLKIEESGKVFSYNCCNLLESRNQKCSKCCDIVEDLIYIKSRKTEIYKLFQIDWKSTRLKIPNRRLATNSRVKTKNGFKL